MECGIGDCGRRAVGGQQRGVEDVEWGQAVHAVEVGPEGVGEVEEATMSVAGLEVKGVAQGGECGEVGCIKGGEGEGQEGVAVRETVEGVVRVGCCVGEDGGDGVDAGGDVGF